MLKACGTPVPRRAAARHHGPGREPATPASGSTGGASPGRGKEATPGLLAAPGPPRRRRFSPPGAPRPAGPAAPSRAVGSERRAGSRPLGPGGREGETRPRKHPGRDEGGAGKLAASSRPRLRSPLLSCPKSSRLQKIFVCTISWYWS